MPSKRWQKGFDRFLKGKGLDQRLVEITVGPHDILTGQSPYLREHIGNKELRRLIEGYAPEYFHQETKKSRKTEICISILQTIRGNGGRFLRRIDNRWEEVDNVKRECEIIGSRFRTPTLTNSTALTLHEVAKVPASPSLQIVAEKYQRISFPVVVPSLFANLPVRDVIGGAINDANTASFSEAHTITATSVREHSRRVVLDNTRTIEPMRSSIPGVYRYDITGNSQQSTSPTNGTENEHHLMRGSGSGSSQHEGQFQHHDSRQSQTQSLNTQEFQSKRNGAPSIPSNNQHH